MPREKVVDNRLVGLEASIPHGAPSPVIDSHGAYYALDSATGGLRIATDADKEQSRLQYIEQAIAYTKDLNARSIDARAFFDGRIPDGWTDDQAIPPAALAFGPMSTYASDYASSRLCNCGLDYFRMGMSTYSETLTLQQAS